MTAPPITRLWKRVAEIEFVGESYRFRHRLQQEQQKAEESKTDVGIRCPEK
jgi:hypothetical protein